MPSILKEMEEFQRVIAQDLPKPQRTFLQIFIPALIARGSLVLSQVSKTFTRRRCTDVGLDRPGRRSKAASRDYDTQVHWLSKHLNRRNLDILAVLKRYLGLVAALLLRNDGEGVSVAVDAGDYAKPFARPYRPRGMKGATKVYDGSASTEKETVTVMGYPGLTIEASLPDGNQVPLLHWLYSRDLPDSITEKPYLSDHKTWVDVIEMSAPYVGRRAWWSFDRGFAHTYLLSHFDRIGIRWLVRVTTGGQIGKRWIRTRDGFELPLDDLVPTIRGAHVVVVPDGKRKTKELTIRMGMAEVWLREESSRASAKWETRSRTLLVAWFNDAKKPMVLLASEWLGDSMETAELLRSEYRKRWRVEETHRLNKNDEGWGGDVEGFRVLGYVSIQRVILSWMLICGFVAILRDKYPEALVDLAFEAHAPGPPPRDVRYRVNAVLGATFAQWLPGAWRRRQPKNRKATEGPEPEALRNRLRNAERAVQRARRALEKAGVAA